MSCKCEALIKRDSKKSWVLVDLESISFVIDLGSLRDVLWAVAESGDCTLTCQC